MALFIGVTGPLGSGKSSVLEVLATLAQERGITVRRFSLSDEIRKEVARQGAPLQRDTIKQTAHTFRSRVANGVWAMLVASRIAEDLAAVVDKSAAPILFLIDAIRNPGEVRELRTRFGSRFRLLGVMASPEVIRENLRRRSRSDESTRLLADDKALQDVIAAEMGSGEPGFGHNVSACIEIADWPRLNNDGTLAELTDKVRSLAVQEIFPLLESPALAAPLPTRSIGEAPRALVVEAEASWSNRLAESLRSEGCAVDVAGSYAEAIDRLTSQPYHLATVDMCLSSADAADTRGLELLDTARRIGRSMPSIVVSSSAKPEQIAWALTELGACDFIAKGDFQPEKFRRRVRQLLARIVYVTVTVDSPGDLPKLRLGEKHLLTVALSRTRSAQGISRALLRPVPTGSFELEIVVPPCASDILPGSAQFLTVQPDDTAEPVNFQIVPEAAGLAELVVDCLYQSSMLFRVAIAAEVVG